MLGCCLVTVFLPLYVFGAFVLQILLYASEVDIHRGKFVDLGSIVVFFQISFQGINMSIDFHFCYDQLALQCLRHEVAITST